MLRKMLQLSILLDEHKGKHESGDCEDGEEQWWWGRKCINNGGEEGIWHNFVASVIGPICNLITFNSTLEV